MSYTFEWYSQMVERTDGGSQDETLTKVPHLMICISGEVGELANKIKKQWGHGHTIPLDELIEETGDILWYLDRLTRLTKALGTSLEGAAKYNIHKLERRYPNGFSQEASRTRKV